MTRPLYLTILFLPMLSASGFAGEIKKWTAPDGGIHFGDVPPPGVFHERIKARHDAPPAATALPPDHYSPGNQLRRMEAARAARRQPGRDAVEPTSASAPASAAAHARERAATCEYYAARIAEAEHEALQPYRSREELLRRRSTLARFQALAEKHCH
jgi:hypothetical protein